MGKLPILQALGMLLIAAHGSGAAAQQSHLPTQAPERPPEIARMIRLSDEASNACSRSAAGREERTQRACGRREALTAILNESGWCDRRVDEAGPRPRWHSCGHESAGENIGRRTAISVQSYKRILERRLSSTERVCAVADVVDEVRWRACGAAEIWSAELGRLVRTVSPPPSEWGRPAPSQAGTGTSTDSVTPAEAKAIADRISECFTIPGGSSALAAREAVDVRVEVDSQGVVYEVRPNGSLPTNRNAFRLYEYARRALLDPRCSPLPVSANRLHAVRNSVFRFDARTLGMN